MWNFYSDNVTGAAPAILARVVEGMAGSMPSYGGDALSRALEDRFAALFGCPVAVAPVLTGSAANALALSMLTPAYGVVFAHGDAHVVDSECGGPELFTGGARLRTIGTGPARLTPDAVREAVGAVRAYGSRGGLPAALTLTQATEWGGVYRADEVAALADAAHGAGLRVHMDGARFANAVAALGCAPGEVTWRAGVDALSFGGTKNGCLMAEAVVLFNPTADQRAELDFRRTRGAQLLSKHRLLALQYDAYLDDGLWLALAGHANAMAARAAAGLAGLGGVAIIAPVEANMLFLRLAPTVHARLAEAGFTLSPIGENLWRMVCAFDTPSHAVDGFLQAVHGAG